MVELSPIQREKTQPSGGRFDLLLADDDGTRYEVEVQLGATDPSHIIRTIEYWTAKRSVIRSMTIVQLLLQKKSQVVL